MSTLHVDWLEAAVLCPLVGAVWVSWLRDSGRARRWSLLFSSLTLAIVIGAWLDLILSDASEARGPWRPGSKC